MSLETLRSLAKEIAETEKLIRQAEEDKDETIHLMQQMLDYSTEAILWKDTNGYILGCNKACEQILGMSRNDLIGKTIKDLFENSQADLFEVADLLATRSGAHSYELEFKSPTGKVTNIKANVWRLTTLDNSPAGVIVFAYFMSPTV